MGGNDGELAELHQHVVVPRVREILDGRFEHIVDGFNVVVVARVEEDLDGIRPAQQMVLLAVALDGDTDILKHLGIKQVFRIFDDDLLAGDVTLGAQTQNTADDLFVQVYIEHHRVLIGLISEEGGDGGKCPRRDRHAEGDGPLSFTGHLITRVVEDIVNDEHQHRHDDGHSETALADDGTQRRADEEEDQARERQRELLDGLQLVVTIIPVQAVGVFGLHLHVHLRRLHTRQGALDCSLTVSGRLSLVDGVDGRLVGSQLLHHLHRVLGSYLGQTQAVALGVDVERIAHAVVMLLDGVDVVQQPAQGFHTGVAGDVGHICHVQAAVEVDDDALRRECLTPVGDVGAVGEVLRTHVLKPLAAIKCQQQMLLLFRRLHHA